MPARSATGTIATAGSATPITPSRRSTASARSTCSKAISPICATSSTAAKGGHIQPLYGVLGEADAHRAEEPELAGYRGMGPVRVGNQAYRAGPARRLWPDRAVKRAGLLRPAAVPHVGRRGFRWRSNGSANAPGSCTTSPMPACGNCAPGRASTPIPPRCAGRHATGSPTRLQALGLSERGAFWQQRADAIRARIEQAAWRARYAAAVGDLRRRRSRRQRAAAARSAIPRRPTIRAFATPSPPSRPGCGAARTCCATPPRTISACPKRPSTSAPSG